MITEQGLRSSLHACAEFGYKSHERGENIQKMKDGIHQAIEDLVKASGLAKEICKIRTERKR